MEDNKTERIFVKLTKEEKEKAQSTAKNNGLSLSAYVRKVLSGKKIVAKTDIQMLFEIKKIGANVNQLAKHVNTLPVDEEILYAVQRLDGYIKEIKEIGRNLYDCKD